MLRVSALTLTTAETYNELNKLPWDVEAQRGKSNPLICPEEDLPAVCRAHWIPMNQNKSIGMLGYPQMLWRRDSEQHWRYSNI